MRSSRHRPRALAIAATLAAGPGGCVNNYVVDESASSSSSTTADEVTTTGSSPSTSTTTGATEDGDAASTQGSDSGSNGADGQSTDTDPPLGACQPCLSDAQCGDRSDLCVTIGPSETVCLRVCVEGPMMCSSGFSCMAITSVDEIRGNQCVPDGGTCGE